MGEVYKARDTRLDRTVAIKVLPEHVATDPDLKQRFEREARTVAALNHPHICTLFDIGREGETDFLVMEYLDGETLAQRLEKGALPLDQALQIAIQIADALDKAHRQGIVHRDLKPGNIMLTKAGAKLLDFGLAKLKPAVAAFDASGLPTKSASLTGAGTILGTLQYMAPEQLEAKDVDARTDLFAFGTLVYEMVTGKRAFTGDSQASLIGAILKDEPSPVSTVQPLTPVALDYVVKHCLAKGPDDRWQSAADVGRQMKGIVEGDVQPSVAASDAGPERSRWRRTLSMAVATATIAAGIAGLAVWNLVRPSPQRVARVALTTPGAPIRALGDSQHIAISPDGTQVAYIAAVGSATDRMIGSGQLTQSPLYLRAVDQFDISRIGGLDEGLNPFFSPDGNWVAYQTPDFILKRVSIQGGPPVPVAQIEYWLQGASWGPDDTIILADLQPTGLFRVAAGGGELEPLTVLEAGEAAHRHPEILPGGRAILFTVVENTGNMNIVALDLDTVERTVLIRGGSYPQYAATGHIVYAVDGTLRAVGFDADRLELTSTNPVPVVTDVGTMDSGVGNFDLALDGSLVYVGTRGIPGFLSTLVWVDREGREEPLPLPPHRPQRPAPDRTGYRSPRLSPDGNHLAVIISTGNAGRFDNDGTDVWFSELAGGTLQRLPTPPGGDSSPIWTQDGERIVFARNGGGSDILPESLARKPDQLGFHSTLADGTGQVERLPLREEADAALF